MQLKWQQRHSDDVSVVRRGDIVWARVQFPHRWWPALVLSSDGLGVLVSFFENDVVSPTYFVESEVVPFESTFRSLMAHHNNIKRCDTFYALLGSALRFLGQRVISSLTCRCQMGMKRGKRGTRKVVDGSDSFSSSFEPFGVLGFVRNVAVLPWVDEPDLVDAVRVVAQVHAFRDYCCSVQKRVYRETPKGGDEGKLHRCSSSGRKVQTVVIQESLALEPKDEYLITSKQGKKISDVGAIVRFKETVPVLEGNSEQLCENKLRIILEIPTKNKETEFLKKISFDMNRSAFKMIRETQKCKKMSILRFNNIADLVIADICFRNCSTMKKTHFSVPCNSETHSSSHDNKRRRLDKPNLCDSFVTQSPQIIKSGKKKDSDVSISSSALENFFSRFGMGMDLYNNFMLDSPTKLRIQDSLRFTSTCGNSLMNLLPYSKDASCHVVPQIFKAQGIERNAYISYIKMLEPEETYMNFTDEVQKADLKKFQDLPIEQRRDDSAVNASAEKVEDMLGSSSSIYPKKNGETTHLKSKKSARVDKDLGQVGAFQKQEMLGPMKNEEEEHIGLRLKRQSKPPRWLRDFFI